METIKNYLDNMFSGLPKTEEMTRLKDNIYENMQDKYQELKASGKSENEAIGVVISEFGNIEELMEEFDVYHDNSESQSSKASKKPKEVLPEVNMDTANEYIRLLKMAGKFIGIGVSLCILGVAILIAGTILTDFEVANVSIGNIPMGVGLAIMFLFITGGVALFVYSGFLLAPYEYMEKPINISEYVKQQISARWNAERPANMVKLIIGICMCVMSPIPIILASFMGGDQLILGGVVLLLIIVAVAVNFIIAAGCEMEGYSQILEIGDYTPSKKRSNKAVEIVASVIWPLVTAVYLFIGFIHGLWHPGWVIFPITGILFGVFAAICEALSRK